MRTYTIQPFFKIDGVGREFRARLLCHLSADDSWDSGLERSDSHPRPVFLSFLGTDSACKALMANLRSGRQAEITPEDQGSGDHKIGFRKSDRLKWQSQEVAPGHTAVTAYLPALFDLDPGLPPERVRFLFMPPGWWTRREAGGSPDPAAALFAAYLDKRTPLPVLHDPSFARRLYDSAAEMRWAHRHQGFRWQRGKLYCFPEPEHNQPPEGFSDALLIDATQDEISVWLRRQLSLHRKERKLSAVERKPLEVVDLLPPADFEAPMIEAIAEPFTPVDERPRYFGQAGHCVSIDGDLWHEPGRCRGAADNCDGKCCGYETDQPQPPKTETEPTVGETRIESNCGILPAPHQPARQLSLLDLF